MWLLLALAVSSHISGWLKEWKEVVFFPLAGILHLVLEAFKGYNQGWLGRAANLVGAHRVREGPEVGRWGLPAGPVQAGRYAVERISCN